ncbi:MAG: RNA pyrophosphohydrolase [Methyloligellaceae bacterium]
MATDPFARLPYRPCVGIFLLNRAGSVWIGRRLSKWDGDRSENMWQMPQGGIDAGETPRAAAFRELGEEIGTSNAEIIAESQHWLTYDLPPEALGTALKGKYRGQRQKWFAMRFQGRDEDIDIAAKPGHKAEFDAWRWAPVRELSGLVVPFKRATYEAVVAEFGKLAAA